MSGKLADPGHVGLVRRWLAFNSERIAAVIEPPGAAGKASAAGADFVRWLGALLDQHQTICQQEYDRSGGSYHRYAGD